MGPEPRLQPSQVQRLVRSNVNQFGVVAHARSTGKSQPYNTRDGYARGSPFGAMAPLEVCVKRVVNGLDELEVLVGTDLGTSDWLTVTQEMVDTFSEVTGDHQWIHLDPERARRELPFGGPIVQGLLTLSLIVRFRHEILELRGVTRFINYGYDRVRFAAPIPVGSRLRATQTLLVAERVAPDVLRAKSKFVVEAEGIDKPACIAEAITLAYA